MAKPSPLEQFLFKAIESHGLFQPKKAEDGLQLTPSVGSSTSSYTPPGIAPQSMNYTPVVSDEAYNDSKHAFEKRAGRDAFFSRLGNTAKNAGLALPFLVDHFLPGQPIKQPQVKPLETYNPNPYGTGSQALYKNGGKLKAAAGMELSGGPGDGPYSFVDEFKKLSKNKLDGASSFQIAKKAADSTGINPSLLYSSSYVEGMNKNLTDSHPLISDAYENAQKGYYTDFTGKKKLGKQSTTIDPNQYPVDGFATYGLDTFGSRFDEFVKKGYLPETFKDQFVPYTASNEKETVQTAAFKNNEAALMAKAAYLRSTQDDVDSYFKEKKQELDPEARDFFTMAFYNSTRKSARGMADEYMSAKDKKAFIEKGDTKYKSIWSNIHQRMELMPLVSESMSQMKYGGKMKKCENGLNLMEGQSYDLDPATIKELLNAGYQLDFE